MKKYLVGMMICLWSYVALAQAENLGMQDYAMRFAEVKTLQSDFTEAARRMSMSANKPNK